jgi:hypothetical protein
VAVRLFGGRASRMVVRVVSIWVGLGRFGLLFGSTVGLEVLGF